MAGTHSSRILPPAGEKTLLVILWRRSGGGWAGRVKRLADGTEVYVKDLDTLLELLMAEERRDR